ncbi:hypothetical protein GBBBJNDB_00380 [Pseudomonas phage Callisto]|uniref:Uncharacterized protein n=1 Tax=Pseudomonas phage vB_PaeM_PA5oct TaxID=2163605 RepID=A0A4Y5JU66_9CAUD|nr:hypothetical protein PQE65_gp366 [Pseudomonas phage vB_PaeM_PA5oct]QCG75999.1 hypothetical protein EST35_0117 [Pseudomonas phage vB_PaeM_PA5oct]WMI32071.1 hypothetical protein GBBBJNDB_00380 [Pseudomonas phage Callisto]WPK40141.1 hypothetical protein ETTORE_0432 [Pseudomonas phage Ettore]WPK40655.1 hypothetical protein Paride_0425 [Pseudomonas phage Paride]
MSVKDILILSNFFNKEKSIASICPMLTVNSNLAPLEMPFENIKLLTVNIHFSKATSNHIKYEFTFVTDNTVLNNLNGYAVYIRHD